MAKLIKLWVLGSAACVSAGWVLSAAHELNWKGYAVFFSVLFIALAAEYQLRRRLRAVNHPAELVRPAALASPPVSPGAAPVVSAHGRPGRARRRIARAQ